MVAGLRTKITKPVRKLGWDTTCRTETLITPTAAPKR